MSETTGVSTKAEAERQEVADYVASVRAALRDIGPEEVEDLTGGMDADLAELLAERGGALADHLGQPTAYAVELRQAAGLPPEPEAVAPRRVDPGEWWSRRRSRMAAWRETQPWRRSVWSFLISIRPAWWVFRGLAIGYGLSAMAGITMPTLLPHQAGGWLFAVLGVIGSVLLGRGMGPRGARPALTALAGVIAVPALLVGASAQPESSLSLDRAATSSGLSMDGTAIDNLYAYDADGNRLSDIRLFGQDGQPITVDRFGAAAPGRPDVHGGLWRNVFPKVMVGNDPWAPNGWWTPLTSLPPLRGSSTGTPSPTATPQSTQPTTGSPAVTVTVTSSGGATTAPTR